MNLISRMLGLNPVLRVANMVMIASSSVTLSVRNKFDLMRLRPFVRPLLQAKIAESAQCRWKKFALRKPLLYLSLYLKAHRTDYYRLLQEVREHGAWEAWLDFFLTGVADTANQAFDAATQIIDLFKEEREWIIAESDWAGSALRVHELFQQNPFLTGGQLVLQTGLSNPTVNAALADLERFGIIKEITGRKRGRVFSYHRYLAILSEGTNPLLTPT